MYRTRRGELRCLSRSRMNVLPHRFTPNGCCHLVHLADAGVFRKAKRHVMDSISAHEDRVSGSFLCKLSEKCHNPCPP